MATYRSPKITVPTVSAVANTSVGPAGNISGWLDHAPPAFDAFVRLQEQGVSVEDAYQRFLAEQGQEFLDACDFEKTHRELVSYDNLAELTALSQKVFARQPPGLPALAQWSDHVSGFRVSCEPFR